VSALTIISGFILFIKAGWFGTWLDARKHGVNISKKIALGSSPIHGLFAALALISFIYSWCWMIHDSTSNLRLMLTVAMPLPYIAIIIARIYKKI
jgi:hypothetical protein